MATVQGVLSEEDYMGQRIPAKGWELQPNGVPGLELWDSTYMYVWLDGPETLALLEALKANEELIRAMAAHPPERKVI